MSDARRYKLMNKLLTLSSLTGKKLIELDKDDYFELISKIKERGVKPVTIEDYSDIKNIFKIFWQCKSYKNNNNE